MIGAFRFVVGLMIAEVGCSTSPSAEARSSTISAPTVDTAAIAESPSSAVQAPSSVNTTLPSSIALAPVASAFPEGESPPSLSPKKDRAVFARTVGKQVVDGDTVNDTRIFLRVVADGSIREIAKNGVCIDLSRPVFADASFVLVAADLGWHHTGVCGIDLSRPIPIVIQLAGGTDCVVAIGRGSFEGDFFVAGWQQAMGDSPHERYEIINRHGKVVAEAFPDPMEDPIVGAEDGIGEPATGAYCLPAPRLSKGAIRKTEPR
jgi:hypothetical protein